MATTLEGIAFGTTVRVEPWTDPVLDAVGHDPRSEYVERFWLPILGPSTTWLLRHLATQLERAPKGVLLDVSVTARTLGLGERTGRHGPFLRTVARAIDFEAARLASPQRLEVRRRLPGLARRHLLRLPESLREAHARQMAGSMEGVDQLRRRARQLALSLTDLGEVEPEIARQLERWHFHPSLVEDALAWARTERARRVSSVAGATGG